MTQLVFGVYHKGTVRVLGGLSSHFGAPHFFYSGIAERPGAGLRLTGLLFHAPENISCLVDQIKSSCASISSRMPSEANYVFVIRN